MDIGKDWRIEADALNATILKRHTTRPKDGEPAHGYWTREAYFSNPKNALNWLVNQKVMETGMADLETVVAAIEELHTLIEGLKNLPEIPRETASAIEKGAKR